MFPKIKKSSQHFRQTEANIKHQTINDINQISEHFRQLNKQMCNLVQIFKLANFGQMIKNGQSLNFKENQETKQCFEDQQERFKNINIPIWKIQNNENRSKQIKKFIADATSLIFSLGFRYFQQGKLSQRKFRLFCCHNLMHKIISFSQVNNITEKQLQEIDIHLSKRVLPFLKCKYPQSENNQSNLKLSSLITQLDNFSSNSNDLIFKSGVIFEKKQSGDYSSEIMLFLNYVIDLTKKPTTQDKSLFNKFYEDMQNMFTRVESEEWVFQAKKGNFTTLDHIPKQKDDNLQQRVNKEKYKQKVQQYSKYLIGKKISDNVANYSSVQINELNLRLKNPGMMRIVTKWCEQLQKIFHATESISFREEMFRMRDGSERYLTKNQKKLLAESLMQKKQDINKFVSRIKANLYENQSTIIKSDKPQTIFRDFSSESQSIVGYMTSVVAKCNQNYLLSYLNKLIDCILDAEQLWMKKMRHKAHYKQQIPTLLTFKVADLLRCKFSSKQTEITTIFSYIKYLSQKNPDIMEMVRVKNRLSQGTKDILINFRYRNSITAEMQLSVDEDKSNFIKCSDKANHFIYQLERASFGPLSEIINVCYNVDQRSAFFMKVFDSKNQWSYKEVINQMVAGHQSCFHEWQQLILPIWCSQCESFNASCSLITPHKKCTKCRLSKCSKCIVSSGQFQQVSILKQIKWSQFFDKFTKQQQGVVKVDVIDLEKKKAQIKSYTAFKTEQRIILFINDEQNQCLVFERQVKIYEKNKFIKQVESTVQIVKINELSKTDTIKLIKLCKSQMLKKSIKQVKKNGKMIFIHDEEPIENFEIFNGVSLESIKKLSFKSIGLASINWMPKTFPSCEVIILSKNLIKDFTNGNNFKCLKRLFLQFNNLQVFPKQLSELKNLQTLNLSNNMLTQVDDQMCKLVKLKQLILQNNKISKVSQKVQNFVNLQVLWLKENKLETIPTEIGRLSKLKSIVLDQNKIQIIPPQLKNLENLQLLNLNSNLICNLPNQIFQDMKKLKDLWIYKNKLSKIPQSIKNLVNLTRISMFKNNIQKLPKEIGQLKKLEYVNFSFNDNCDLSQMQNLNLNNIVEVRVEGNNLTKLPQNLFKMKNMKSLFCGSNPLQTLAPQIGNLRKLIQLSVTQIGIKQIPLELFNLKHLEILYLNRNKLRKIPQQICKLNSLEILDLSQNQFQQFPKQISELQNLNTLFIDQNLFTQVPSQIGKLKNLKEFSVQSRKLKLVAKELQNIQKLEIFQINYKILSQPSREMCQMLLLKLLQKSKGRNKE